MTVPTPETQFVVDLPAELRPFVAQHYTTVMQALCAALGAVFEVSPKTACRLSLRYRHRLQLIEVNGRIGREASPAEVGGALSAALAILNAQLNTQLTIFDVVREEVQL